MWPNDVVDVGRQPFINASPSVIVVAIQQMPVTLDTLFLFNLPKAFLCVFIQSNRNFFPNFDTNWPGMRNSSMISETVPMEKKSLLWVIIPVSWNVAPELKNNIDEILLIFFELVYIKN